MTGAAPETPLDRAAIAARIRQLSALGLRLAALDLGAENPLTALLSLGIDQPASALGLTPAELSLLIDLGVVVPIGANLHAQIALSAISARHGDVLVAHERRDRAREPNSVMPPDGASQRLLLASPVRTGRWLDIGTGAGSIAIAAARAGATVRCADLNPRVPPFVELGAALSGVTVAVQVSDLTRDLPRERHDVITFAPPQLYGENVPLWQTSPEGPPLLARFFSEMPELLSEAPGAEVLVNADLPDEPLPQTGGLLGLARPGDFRVLRIRLIQGDGFAMSLLWMARRRTRAWWAEVDIPATDAEPFVPRAELEALIAQNEGS